MEEVPVSNSVNNSRLKHDANMELVRAKELLNTQSSSIVQLERRLTSGPRQRPLDDAFVS